jgi:manganese/zinc/iron transport system permease protein
MGLVTVWLIEVIQRYGKVEESAAIGVVFTSLFAIGLVMMVRAADKIDLDPSCVLYGSLETIILEDKVATPLGEVPPIILRLGCICLLNAAAVVLLYKQWQISTFDPLFSMAQGIRPSTYHYLLASLVAITCIASFEAVGNILVVAMLVVPPATAFLLCNRLSTMIGVSVLVAIVSAILGHLCAISIPHAFGFKSVNSAAMIAVACGFLLVTAVVVSPKAGVLAKWWNQQQVARKIVGEDALAFLYRYSERLSKNAQPAGAGIVSAGQSIEGLAKHLAVSVSKTRSIANDLVKSGWVLLSSGELHLTDDGRRMAQNLVRSHRLWEQYLAVEMNVSEARLHAQAESLEHFTSPSMRGKLDEETGQAPVDPHGSNIPPEG